MIFKYIGRDESGSPARGEVEANSEEEARNLLHERGIHIIEIKRLRTRKVVLKRIKPVDIIFFARQLSLLLRSGFTILGALDAVEENVKKPFLKQIIAKLREDIIGGESFSESLRKLGDVFPRVFIETVHVGEATGNLDSVLLRIADFFEKEEELRRKVRNAFTYPKIVVSLILIAVVFILVTIVPVFTKIYESAGVKLPLPTRILISVSNGVIHYWWVIAIAIFIIYILFRSLSSTKKGRERIDEFLFNMPTILGKIYRENIFLRISHTFETLIRSGISIGEAFELLSQIAGNLTISKAIDEAREKIMQGESISRAILETKKFPPMFTRMIAVGESGGNLEEVLSEMTGYFERELDSDIKRFVALLEPTLTIVLGIIVGFIAFAIYLPLFDMARLITRGGH